MKPKRFSLSSASTSAHAGMSLVELMVAIVISGIIGMMVVSVALSNRTMYQRDIIRTRVNQNARAALDIVGNEIRQAGERLPSTFPAIELVDGASGAADELILRRNLLDDSLVGCANVSANTSISALALSRTSATGVPCTYPNQRIKMNSWNSYAVALSPRPRVYLFNQSTRNGEFARLANAPTTDTGSVIRLNFVSFVTQFAYTQEAASVYVLNEWRFRVQNGILQIVENRDNGTVRNVIDQVANFQVELLLSNGTTVTSLTQAGSWTSIQRVRVTITARETTQTGNVIDKVLTSDFFPRNILST